MGYELSGELLAVTARHFEANERGPASDVYGLTVFDGRVHEARLGRDFPLDARRQLEQLVAKGERPVVRLAGFISSGRFYAESAAVEAAA